MQCIEKIRHNFWCCSIYKSYVNGTSVKHLRTINCINVNVNYKMGKIDWLMVQNWAISLANDSLMVHYHFIQPISGYKILIKT